MNPFNKFNNWFKGNLEGIETDDLDKLLSIFDKFSYNIFIHVYLLNKLDQKFKSNKSLKPINKKKFISKTFRTKIKVCSDQQ